MQSNCIPKIYAEHCQEYKYHLFEEYGLTKSVRQKIAPVMCRGYADDQYRKQRRDLFDV